MEMILHIKDDQITYIYDERLDLSALGRAYIHRVSEVEPDQWGQWWADMEKSRGPLLGPFDKRSEALAAERCWLEENLL